MTARAHPIRGLLPEGGSPAGRSDRNNPYALYLYIAIPLGSVVNIIETVNASSQPWLLLRHGVRLGP